jgi:hypothetical protein
MQLFWERPANKIWQCSEEADPAYDQISIRSIYRRKEVLQVSRDSILLRPVDLQMPCLARMDQIEERNWGGITRIHIVWLWRAFGEDTEVFDMDRAKVVAVGL